MSEEYLWVEKYRPKKIEDCILLPELKEVFKGIVASGELPNMLFTGTAGVGKTTVAKALCNEMGLDWILLTGPKMVTSTLFAAKLSSLVVPFLYRVELRSSSWMRQII